MIQTLPLILLLLSGIFCVVFGFSRISKYGCFLAMILFSACLFLQPHSISCEIFKIEEIDFNLSMSFNQIEMFICAIICAILFCLHITKPNNKSLNKTFGLLNVFAFFMCFCVVSTNLFQFFIGVEALGIISAILVGISDGAHKNSTKTFVFNKFASLVFLIAICFIAINFDTIQFDEIKDACESGDTQKLAIPAALLLISCLCKGAQIPFSHWIIDASKANIFASILLHSATLVAIGIIFITKCYFIFEAFPYLKMVMIVVGISTAFWMSCCSLFHNNIKRIMACSTSASIGIMFVSCGIGEYSLALLYFICHAFFKSMLFLSFSYVIHAMSNEQNILKMGGLSKLIPNVSDVVWISFLSAVGFPFFVGFFAKMSFLGSLQLSNRTSLAIFSIVINIISIIAIFKMIVISMYGKTRADEATISRVSVYNSTSLSSFWMLIIFAVLGSFAAWSMYEWGVLHFGFGGIIYARELFDCFVENVIEMVQIAIAIMLVLLLKNKSKKTYRRKISDFFKEVFKTNRLCSMLTQLIKRTILGLFAFISNMDNLLSKSINNHLFKTIYSFGINMGYLHRDLVFSHTAWILIGIILSFATVLMGKQ